MRLDVDKHARTLAPGRFSWEVAKSSTVLSECKRLVDQVYCERLGLQAQQAGSELVGHAQEMVVLVRDAVHQPVGTLTLQSSAFDWNAAPAALELEHSYRLDTLGIPRDEVAEARRMAILPEQPRAIHHLLAAAIEVSEHAGIRYWVGLVEAVGSSRFDVMLVHHALAAQGLLGSELPLKPHDSALASELAGSGGTAFAADLRRISLPRVRHFAAVLDARAIGVPSLHPHYADRVVVPMRAEVASFKRKFTRRLTPKEAL